MIVLKLKHEDTSCSLILQVFRAITRLTVHRLLDIEVICHSTSVSGGKLVDGSPPARHIEAVGGPLGGGGLATISVLDHRKVKFEKRSDSGLLERFAYIFVCILILLLSRESNKNVDKEQFTSLSNFS